MINLDKIIKNAFLGKCTIDELFDSATFLIHDGDSKSIYKFLEIANNDNYYEKNKILGKHPSESQVITYFIARGFAHYHVTKMIPQKYRNIWHGYNIVYNYDVIRDNHQLGIRIDF